MPISLVCHDPCCLSRRCRLGFQRFEPLRTWWIVQQKEVFMKRNIRWVAWAVAMLGLLGVSTAAQAAALPPGSVGVSVTSIPSFSGTVLAESVGSLVTPSGHFGTVEEFVVTNGTGALCAGCLSFVYQFQVSAGSVSSLAASSYDAFTIDVTQTVGPSASLPGSQLGAFGANVANRNASGTTIEFDFTSPVTAGFGTYLEIVNTNAISYSTGIITISSSSGVANTDGFVPVPEPTTALLVGSSLVALGVWRRRS
jgi:hypothetical protein